jgi:DNA invertase Pin-like site-specific DNA recombinase
MSEAELHILKARMRGGQLNKARRGELEMGPPVGLVYRSDGVIDLDPDAEAQGAIRLVFETFERTGSAVKTVRFFREQGILFPRRLRSGRNKGELLWALPQHARILQVLHNPRTLAPSSMAEHAPVIVPTAVPPWPQCRGRSGSS